MLGSSGVHLSFQTAECFCQCLNQDIFLLFTSLTLSPENSFWLYCYYVCVLSIVDLYDLLKQHQKVCHFFLLPSLPFPVLCRFYVYVVLHPIFWWSAVVR